MKNVNIQSTREAWLRAGTNELRPYFASLGYKIPENIRYALSFTSGGKRGIEGECWHPEFSADGHYEIIIKADREDPVEILGILVHQLIHSLLSAAVKHGKAFRDIAVRVGCMEGKMSHALPSPPLRERLAVIAATLGPLPHAKLDLISGANSAKKKSGVRLIKAECGAACGYTICLLPKWARVGLPLCPVNPEHGALICNLPDDADNDAAESQKNGAGKYDSIIPSHEQTM